MMGSETSTRPIAIGRIVELPTGRMWVREDGVRGGTRPPLLLIHGFAASLNVWDPVMSKLECPGRVIRMDLFGHGQSDNSPELTSVPTQANAILSLLDRLEIDRIGVVAHSGGGDVAVAMIEQDASRVSGIILLGTAPDLKFVNPGFAAKMMRAPWLGPLLWHSVTDGMLRDGLKKTFAPRFARVPEAYVSGLRRMTYPAYVRGIAELERYKNEKDLVSRVKGISVPLLVAFGDEDQWVDPAAAERWADHAGVRIERLPGVGHTAMAEAPQRTAAMVSDFFFKNGEPLPDSDAGS